MERFGVPEDNIQFAHGVLTELKAMGHEVFFLYTDHSQTLKNVSAVVLKEELERKKKEKMSSREPNAAIFFQTGCLFTTYF